MATRAYPVHFGRWTRAYPVHQAVELEPIRPGTRAYPVHPQISTSLKSNEDLLLDEAPMRRLLRELLRLLEDEEFQRMTREREILKRKKFQDSIARYGEGEPEEETMPRQTSSKRRSRPKFVFNSKARRSVPVSRSRKAPALLGQQRRPSGLWPSGQRCHGQSRIGLASPAATTSALARSTISPACCSGKVPTSRMTRRLPACMEPSTSWSISQAIAQHTKRCRTAPIPWRWLK